MKTNRFLSLNPTSTDDGKLEASGTRIYSRTGKQYGVSIGVCGEYNGEAGRSNRIRVYWPDGSYTLPTVAGIHFINNRWQIR